MIQLHLLPACLILSFFTPGPFCLPSYLSPSFPPFPSLPDYVPSSLCPSFSSSLPLPLLPYLLPSPLLPNLPHSLLPSSSVSTKHLNIKSARKGACCKLSVANGKFIISSTLKWYLLCKGLRASFPMLLSCNSTMNPKHSYKMMIT